MNDALPPRAADPTDPRDRRYLVTSPLFHIASLHNLAIPRLATGSTRRVHEGSFDVDRVLRLIEQERVTNWGAVPTMAHRLAARTVPLEVRPVVAAAPSPCLGALLAAVPGTAAAGPAGRPSAPSWTATG